MPHYWLSNIRTLFTEGFSVEQLRYFCYDKIEFRPVYNELAPNSGKSEIIQRLLEHAESQMQLKLLLQWAREQNPARYEAHQPYLQVGEADINIWKAYLQKVEAWREFPSVEELKPYQDLSSTKGVALAEEVAEFIKSPFSLLIIKGPAGCGKSVFLQDLAHHVAINLFQELELDIENPVFGFKNPIPIFFNLNMFSIKPGESLGREILLRMIRPNLLNVSTQVEPETFLRDEGIRWLVLLDAFDEIEPKNRGDVWSAIRELAEAYANVKVILTVRPDVWLYHSPTSTMIISIASLSDQQITEYLKAQLDQEKFNTIFEFLSTEPELWKHLRLPLFLQIAASYLSGGEVSELYDIDYNDPFWEQAPLTISGVSMASTPPHSDQSKTIDLAQIKNFVNEELVNQGDAPPDNLNFSSPPPQVESTNIEDIPIKMGVFLDRIFHRLWKHNEKKRLFGMYLGGLDETYEGLGKMAASMADRQVFRENIAREIYVKEGLYWILDLGLLLKNNNWISFPTILSKIYFAAFFTSIVLESNSSELSNLIRGSPTFWEKCLSFVRDLTYADIAPLANCIDALKRRKG